MAENIEFRRTLVQAENVFTVGAVAEARKLGLDRNDFVENLNFYYGGDESLYEHIVELYDETADKYGDVA